MADRPILFSAPMVRALLAGTKTQTRRGVKPALSEREWVEQRDSGGFWRCADGEPTCHTGVWETHEYAQQYPIVCPYGQPGDRLWVRETHMDLGACYLYRADAGAELERAIAAPRQPWRPAIHMPRFASRITLEVSGVRVERLQDISQDDARAEGAPPSHPSIDAVSREFGYPDFPRSWYAQLWEQINGPDSWAANPWVWVVEFKRVTP